MGFMTNLTARKAMVEHQRGNLDKAEEMYEQALSKGSDDAGVLIAYASLLSRKAEYQKSVDILKKAEKARNATPDQKRQVLMHYAAMLSKLGQLEHAIELLRGLHDKQPNGLLYQTLGYLLIEGGDAEEAMRFNKEAYDYDDEDAIVVDNLAQTYYRLLGDKDTARKYFEKAHKLNEKQVDTLYFLSLYDIEDGKFEDALEKLEDALEGRISPLNYASKERLAEAMEQARRETE